MPGFTATKKRVVETCVIEFLSEFAKYLVAAGITSPRFADITRLAFFKAASAKARFGNERLNQSAVAAMTGLTRVQVREFARQTKPELPRTRDRVDHIIEGWSADPAFSRHGAQPKVLRIDGKRGTFGSLVQKYGGDLPPRAVLRELQRHGHVTLRGGKVSLTRAARQTRDEHRLRRTSRLLEELIRATETMIEPQPQLRTFHLETKFPAASEKGRLVLQKRVAETLGALMSSIHAAGTSVAMDAPPARRQRSRTTRARVALIMEDFESIEEERATGKNRGGR
jgi:hypothetical protein